MTPNDIATANAFHDAQGTHWGLWGIIEGSGMADGDRWTGAGYGGFIEASLAMQKTYASDEIADLHVAVARWDRQGEFWTYDF